MLAAELGVPSFSRPGLGVGGRERSPARGAAFPSLELPPSQRRLQRGQGQGRAGPRGWSPREAGREGEESLFAGLALPFPS